MIMIAETIAPVARTRAPFDGGKAQLAYAGRFGKIKSETRTAQLHESRTQEQNHLE